MDGLSGVTSVIAVAELCEKVIKYVNNVCDAHKDMKRLRDQVRNCHVALLLLQDAGEVPEAAESWSHTLSALQGPLKRLQVALENAANVLNVADTTKEKFKWPFKKDEVQKLIQVIEAEKGLLNLALNRDSASLIHKIQANSQKNNALLEDLLQQFRNHVRGHEAIADEIKDGLSAMSLSQNSLATGITELQEGQMNQEKRRERESILSWISQIDHAVQQHDVLSRRQTGTGEWLLAAEGYRTWLNGDQQTLFCPGIPGAGKTVLSSIVNEDLWTRHHENRTVGLSFLFCNYKRREEQTIEGLLASLVRQLAERQLRLPDSLRVLYTNHGRGQRRPSVTNICEVLQSIIEGLSKVFIVIDGIDECCSEEGCRARLITQVLRLQAIRNVHLFVTTRHIPEITENFRGAPILEIRANDEDVRMYLDEKVRHLPKFVQNQGTLQEEIKEKIMKSVDGMFLLAKLYLNSLIGSRSPKAVRATLDNLAKGPRPYDSAYKITMERIGTQIPDIADLAMQALAWITFARTPLTQIVLTDALGIETKELHFDPDNCPDIEDVLSACAGLLTIDHESDVVRLVHFTLQEYFERTQSQWFHDAQEMITSACATYLSCNQYVEDPEIHPKSFGACWTQLGLTFYASKYWMDHARLAKSCNAQVMKFLREPAKVHDATRAMDNVIFEGVPIYSNKKALILPTGLHLAAYVGLIAETIEMLPSDDLNELHNRTVTPLMLASHEGHVDIVKALLDHKATLDLVNSEGKSALYYAASEDQCAVLEVLLSDNADKKREHRLSESNYSPLYVAAERGHDMVMRLLLKYDFPVNFVGLEKESALVAAINFPTQLIYSLGASDKLRDPRALVSLLDSVSQNELKVEIRQQREAMVRLLVKNGADLTLGHNRKVPMIEAARSGLKSFIEMLLDKGMDIDMQDKDGRSSLHEAAQMHQRDVVELLIQRGATVDIEDKSGNTPLYLSIYHRDDTAYDLSSSGRQSGVVQLLLKSGADINKCNRHGQCPVSAASEKGHDDILKLLLADGASANIADTLGCTPFFIACKKIHSLRRLDVQKCLNEYYMNRRFYRRIPEFPLSNGGVNILWPEIGPLDQHERDFDESELVLEMDVEIMRTKQAKLIDRHISCAQQLEKAVWR